MKTKIFLALVIILAFILRFYRLGDYPAFNADEAAIGYNAYSLIQTGKDEHGNSWPIHFQSFNDYKPGLYFYLALPFVKVLGLNEWAVRIPNVTLGVLTVLIVYFLCNELFKDRKFGIWAALLLTISPWHIHFSRGGWEVNAATFFITFGVWLFFKALNDKLNIKYLALSVLSFVASLYTYHAARIIVPLLGLGFLIIYRKRLLANIKPIIIASFMGLILLIPLAKDLVGPAGISRAAGVGLFADPGPLSRVNEQRGEHRNYQGFVAKILHNKPVNYGLAFLENWGKHFEGNFLFLTGDEIQRDKVPETGEMYIFDFLFLVIGLVSIIRISRGWSPILFWLAIAPAASALTFQSPHALRAENMVIPLTIISAYGLYEIIKWLNGMANKKLRTACYILLATVIFWNFARYLHIYYIHMAKEYPYSSQYGVKELVSYVKENSGKYDQIFITDRYDQPYILFLFYLKYPPEKFQKEHTLTTRDIYGFSTVRKFDKYTFVSVNWKEFRNLRNVLIVGTPGEIPPEGNIIKKIPFPNGEPAFEIVEF